MVDEAGRLNRKLMVGHILRFDTKCATIKERITRGELGQLLTVYCRRNTARALIKSSRPHLFQRSAIHDIDLILWYFEGTKPVEVYMKSMDAFGEGDDIFWGMITFDDGSLGIVENAWALPAATPWRGQAQLEAVGTQGTAFVDAPGTTLEIWTGGKVERPNTGYWTSLHGTTVGALRDEIAYFLRCLREDRPITMPLPEDSYKSLHVTEALLRSSREGHPIHL
jgi:predicted dehydrogenase